MLDKTQSLNKLIAGYRPGYSMEAEFYNSEAIYQRDLEKIFYRRWIYAGHTSQLPDAGCYLLTEIGQESIIVARDSVGQMRAFANVCRHRGSRLCVEHTGKVRAFVCPYHAWTYELNGELRSRRSMPADFDSSDYGLKTVRLEIFHGMIFINLDPHAPGLVQGLEAVDPSYRIYDLQNAKVAVEETFSVDANWKLALENFMECYHCAPAHPEYARCHALKSPKDCEALKPAMLAEAKRLGFETDPLENHQAGASNDVQYYYTRHPLYPPNVSGSEDGKPVAPLLGKIAEFGGGVADTQIGPTMFSVMYPDHAVLYRFIPRGAQRTDMDIIWLVSKDAEQGRDFDLNRLTWLWRVTTEADKTIILNNQLGVNSRFYEPGPLSEMEIFTGEFIEWYLTQIA